MRAPHHLSTKPPELTLPVSLSRLICLISFRREPVALWRPPSDHDHLILREWPLLRYAFARYGVQPRLTNTSVHSSSLAPTLKRRSSLGLLQSPVCYNLQVYSIRIAAVWRWSRSIKALQELPILSTIVNLCKKLISGLGIKDGKNR